MKKTKRRERTRKPAPDLILIVTEGEKTEPMYFKKFPIHTTKVLKVIGTGTNTESLIRETDKEVEKAMEAYKKEYDIQPKDVKVWCVFDKDSFSASEFGNAINMARERGYSVAYSNEAFELWYLLHYQYHTSAISRKRYNTMLSRELHFKYQKNDENMYQVLIARQDTAIKYAKQLMNQYEHHNPNKDNPCTSVYQLVEYLNQFIT